MPKFLSSRSRLLHCLANGLLVFTLGACATHNPTPQATANSLLARTVLPSLTASPKATSTPTRTASPLPTGFNTPVRLPSASSTLRDNSARENSAGHFPSLVKIKMFDAQRGWAIAGQTDNQLLRTDDGGQTWRNVMPLPRSSIALPEGVFFLDASTAFLQLQAGGRGVITPALYRTQDGGQTWQSWPTPFRLASSLVFFDQETGWAAADLDCPDICRVTLYRTLDAGKSWARLADATSPFGSQVKGRIPHNLFFQNASTVWLREDVSSLYVSRDAGKTWQQKQPPLQLPPVNDYQWGSLPIFRSDREGFFYVILTGQELVVYSTIDGGDTWTPTPARIDAGTFDSGGDFVTTQDWFVNCGDRLCATQDGGRTWQFPLYRISSSGDTRVMAIDFSDPSTGWALVYLPENGGDYTLYHTPDGGRTWQPMQPRLVSLLSPTVAP